MRSADASWPPRLAALAVFATLGASAVLWALRWPVSVPDTAQAAHPAPQSPASPPAVQALAQVLGASAPAPATPSLPAEPALVLSGVVAQAGGQGSALIAVAGAAQKSYRVGAVVAPGLVLQSVHKRSAELGPQLHVPATLVLELPAPPAATRP